MDTLLLDIRYALRTLRRSPGFSLIAIATLALGIGANSTIFSIVNAALLRPIPGIAEPSRVVQLFTTNAKESGLHSFSYAEFLDYQRQASAFAGLEAEANRQTGLRVGNQTERVLSTWVSANYFSVLGVTPALGRFFTPDEDVAAGAKPVVVLGYRMWRERFGGDPQVLGRTLVVAGHELTIIGVAPEQFGGSEPVVPPQFWIPFHAFPAADIPVDLVDRGNAGLRVIGRLAPGASVALATKQLTQIAARQARAYPGYDKDAGATATSLGLFPAEAKGAAVAFLTLLMVVVGLVLVIACANLANLLLARATARQREIAVRLALGASRRRVIRQLLTESALLGVLGGTVGILLAINAIDLIAAFKPPFEGLVVDISLDWRVLFFTAAVSVATGILFGLAPALQVTQPSLVPALKDASVQGYRRSRLRNGLVVTQFAFSLFLLIGAGLFVRSLRNAQSIDTGFRADHVLLASIQPAIRGYDEARTRVFMDQLLPRIRALPGVRAAAIAENTPLGFGRQMLSAWLPGKPERESHKQPVDYNVVSAGYFETMRMQIVRGRAFTGADQAINAANGVIINETLARQYWPHEDPIGKTLNISHGEKAGRTVVGVVHDGKYRTLGEEAKPFVYVPYEQTSRTLTLHVLTSGDPAALAPALRREVQQVDNDMPMFDVKTLDQHMGISLLPARVAGNVLGLMGLLALVLAAVGIYGVMAFAVTQRTREIGIRMAIGARAADILSLFIGQGLRLSAIGMLIGLACALVLTRFATAMLYGISAADPITYVGVSVILGLVALMGVYIPARRATRVDPMAALRSE